LDVFVGNARNSDNVVRASSGTDVVISTLGTRTEKSGLMTDAITAVISAAKASKPFLFPGRIMNVLRSLEGAVSFAGLERLAAQ
jgi:hypothetical protein